MSQRIPAVFEDIKAMKGHYLRNIRDDKFYKIDEVGREGITVHQAEGFGGQTFGPEITITWRAVKKLYSVLVHAADIETKAVH